MPPRKRVFPERGPEDFARTVEMAAALLEREGYSETSIADLRAAAAVLRAAAPEQPASLPQRRIEGELGPAQLGPSDFMIVPFRGRFTVEQRESLRIGLPVTLILPSTGETP